MFILGYTFTATLYQPDEHSFSVSFAVNGITVTSRFTEPFWVSLPWSGGPVSCISESGETTDASLDTNRAGFPLYKTGTYSLKETNPVVHNTNAPLPETVNISRTNPLTDAQPPARSYSDGWGRVATALLIGLAGFGAFFGFTRKRPVKRR